MMTIAKLLSFCLLLFDCGSSKDFKCTLEAFIKKSVHHDIKFPSLLKRQLANVDDDTSEIYGGLYKDTVESATEDTTLPNVFIKATRRQIFMPRNTRPYISDNEGCKCKVKDVIHESVVFKDTKTLLEKALFPDVMDEDTESDQFIGTTPIKRSAEESTTVYPTFIAPYPTERALNETHLEVNETEFQIVFDMNDVCPYFKQMQELDLDKMADVWQLSHYRGQEKLACFKIYLNKTTIESRMFYSIKFSSFNETINWKDCYLELTSTGRPKNEKRHFLQGNKNSKSILENIVLSLEKVNDSKVITLLEQTPDQWMMNKDLLLMRDCNNGDIVIFARVPTVPTMTDIEEALVSFGEDGLDGVTPCIHNNELVDDPYLRIRYDILS